MTHDVHVYITNKGRYVCLNKQLDTLPWDEEIISMAKGYGSLTWRYRDCFVSGDVVTWYIEMEASDRLLKGYKMGRPKRPADKAMEMVPVAIRGDYTILVQGEKWAVNGDFSPLRMRPYNLEEKSVLEIANIKAHIFETDEYPLEYDQRLVYLDGPNGSLVGLTLANAYTLWKEHQARGKHLIYITTSSGHIINEAREGSLVDAWEQLRYYTVKDLWYSHTVYDANSDFSIAYFGAITEGGDATRNPFDQAMLGRYIGDNRN